MLRPLAASRADQRRFVNRAQEVADVRRAITAELPALVLGEAGSGRTSLLNRVAWLLRRQTQPVESVIVTGEVARDAAQLLGVLVARVQRVADPAAPRGRWLDDLRALTLPDGPFGPAAQPAVLMELIDLLGEHVATVPGGVCLMIDGVSPAVAHAVFGSLRNELWTLDGARWVIAGDVTAERLYREPPADAFFERTVTLGPLPPAQARKLLRAHMPELPAAEVDRAVAVGGGNPRRLLRAAADIRAGLEPTPPATDALAERAAQTAGPLAGRLVEYLTAHGPAAASDPQMLAVIGFSRQRASQLMHQLEAAGLLETLEEHEPARRGRPARRFAVRARS